MTEAAERALARVRLGAVERNSARLRSLLGESTALCAVVKADAYGHGVLPCAGAALAGGATWLGVATADEAVELRDHGVDAPILVMGALTGSDARAAVAAGADVVAWNAQLVEELAVLSSGAERPVGVHVKLDTGMGRLGARDADTARSVAEQVAGDERLRLAGVMTHFATADEPGDDHFPRQLAAFAEFAAEVKGVVPNAIAHAANSAASFRDPASHFDMVRCGIALYGLDPFQDDPAPRGLEPALALESYVSDVKRFGPGESAGYGRRWTARQPTWVAVAPIGYGDGVRRGLSDNAEVLVRGRRRPLVGTVSMDNVTVELGTETDVEPGDRIVLIGEQGGERILCEDVARRLETINYEVTCGLSPRVKRLHEAG